ncbi:unnamed protein product [Urochloa humidicola]
MAAAEQRLSPADAAPAVMSTVLDDDDMLGEILLRLAFPTRLVRAALVCRRWLCVASQPAFLRRFRDLHPPLLGFYVEHGLTPRPPWFPKFVSMPNLPVELAAAVRTADTVFDVHAEAEGAVIKDCRNSRLFVRLHDRRNTDLVLNPLHPQRDPVSLSPPLRLPRPGLNERISYGIEYLPNGGPGGEDVCITDISSSSWQPQVTNVEVYWFSCGDWHSLASIELPGRMHASFHLALIDGDPLTPMLWPLRARLLRCVCSRHPP